MDKSTHEALLRLTKKPSQVVALVEADTPVPINSKTGLGQAAAKTSTASVDTNLTETDYADREWFAYFTLTSTDGNISFNGRRLKKMVLQDASENLFIRNYKDAP